MIPTETLGTGGDRETTISAPIAKSLLMKQIVSMHMSANAAKHKPSGAASATKGPVQPQ